MEKAIERASLSWGELDPDWVYQKLPLTLQGELDRLANHRFFERFLSLSKEQQRTVMGTMLEEIQHQKGESENRSLSVLEALTRARDGMVEPVKLFSALPEGLRDVLDNMTREHGAGAFCAASSRQQVAVLDSLLRTMNERAAEEAKRRAEEEAKRRAEEEAKRRAEEEAKRRAEEEAKRRAEQEAKRRAEQEVKRRAKEEARRHAEEEAKRRAEEEAKRRADEKARRRAEEQLKRRALIEAGRRDANQCILCGAALGFFHRMFGRDRHPNCVTWKE